MPQTFLPGIINWNTGVSRREIEVFDQGVTLGRYRILFPCRPICYILVNFYGVEFCRTMSQFKNQI